MQQTQLTWWQRYSLWLQQALIRAELAPGRQIPQQTATTPPPHRGSYEY